MLRSICWVSSRTISISRVASRCKHMQNVKSPVNILRQIVAFIWVRSNFAYAYILNFSQNFFATSKYGKTLSRNCNYRIFFYNRLDLTELRHISQQITPQNSTFLQSAFNFLADNFPQHSNYILVDGHYRSQMSQMMVRSNIFPDPESGEIRPIIFFSSVL